MINKITSLVIIIFLFPNIPSAQKKYKDSLAAFQQSYVATHEVVRNDDKKYIQFYKIDKRFCVTATFKKLNDEEGFDMNTSSGYN